MSHRNYALKEGTVYKKNRENINGELQTQTRHNYVSNSGNRWSTPIKISILFVFINFSQSSFFFFFPYPCYEAHRRPGSSPISSFLTHIQSGGRKSQANLKQIHFKSTCETVVEDEIPWSWGEDRKKMKTKRKAFLRDSKCTTTLSLW